MAYLFALLFSGFVGFSPSGVDLDNGISATISDQTEVHYSPAEIVARVD